MIKIETIIIALGTAMVMSMTQYVAKMKDGEPFDLNKFGRTMAAGLGAGIMAWLTGKEPVLSDPASLGAVGMMTGGFDTLSKFVWRLFSRRNPLSNK